MIPNYKEILYDNETITTPRLILRKFTKDDATAILEYGSDAETLMYLPWDGIKTIDEAKQGIIEYYWSRQGFFAIELKESQKCIGSVEVNIDADHEKASFGYVLNRHYWGKGYMTEVLAIILELCFVKLQLNRVESNHYAGNEGSGKVMTKCGMEVEGVGKQEEKVKGIFRDVIHYGITKDRWEQLK
ncbi:MAG: GNAT family N-acetyltransferase [Defluviitaleaceae bacterium]|nr:GNAT family N-acetyltransferase [Defluviitaleaceae bacterium]